MIDSLVRKEVAQLTAYPETALPCLVKMDANENEWELPPGVKSSIVKDVQGFHFHRYPDSDGTRLRKMLEEYTGIPSGNLLVGSGSDELIRYVVDTFVGPGDRVVIPVPTFSIYGFFVNLAGGTVVNVGPEEDLRVDTGKVASAAAAKKAKVVFLCSPNNPTGEVLSAEGIERVVKKSTGIVVVDEAYYEFCGRTVIDRIKKFQNLIVLRTLSKAAALAGLRVGYLAADCAIMKYLNRVKVPYNVSSFSQQAALRVLENRQAMDRRLDSFRAARDEFMKDLIRIEGITVFPTGANFVLLRMDNAHGVWKGLFEKGILVRKFGEGALENCLRVTICPQRQNRAFIKELKRILGEVDE